MEIKYEDDYDSENSYECESYNDYDVCYECTGYGDDYRIENGELVCNCDSCPLNREDNE